MGLIGKLGSYFLGSMTMAALGGACGSVDGAQPDARPGGDVEASSGDDDPTAHGFVSSSDGQRGLRRPLMLAELPLRIDYLSGDIAFVAHITIGATDLDVLLDSGSSGLRILEGTLDESDFATTTNTHVSVSYGSGTVASGVVATAYVTIAGLVTPSPIPVQRIRTLSCSAAQANCQALGADPATFTFKSGGGGTYRAIMGVGMRNGAGAVGNPIVQLAGAPSFIISANGPYGAAAGRLVIGPANAVTSAFSLLTMPALDGPPLLANGTAAYDDRDVGLCITNTTTAKTYCASALLDTGAAATSIAWSLATGNHTMASGSAVTYDYHATTDSASNVVASFDIVVGDAPTPGLDQITIKPTSDVSSINTGTITFFNERVLFDQANATIGLAPRVD